MTDTAIMQSTRIWTRFRSVFFCIGVALLMQLSFIATADAATANITQLQFTTPPRTVDQSVASHVMTVQTQNAAGTLERLDTPSTRMLISTTSSTGEFSENGSTGWVKSPSFTMNSGSANKNFYYRDITSGSHTLTATATNDAGVAYAWQPATQIVTINAPPPAPAPSVPTINPVVGTTTTPTISGTSDASVQVLLSFTKGEETRSGQTSANESGNWAYVVPEALGDGEWTVTATARVGDNGVLSGASELVTFTVENPPEEPEPPTTLPPTEEPPVVEPPESPDSTPPTEPFPSPGEEESLRTPSQIPTLAVIELFDPKTVISSADREQTRRQVIASSQSSPSADDNQNEVSASAPTGDKVPAQRSTAIVKPSEQGWILFSVPWYWWAIGGLAVFITGSLVQRFFRRNQGAS